MRREAVLSSRIEGTHTTLTGLLREEVTEEDASHSRDADMREVRNYVTALEYGLHNLGQLSLSLRMVKELHRRLLNGVRGQQHRPGEFRTVQNCVGPTGSNEFTAPYVPPPVEYLEACLNDWEQFAHQAGTVPDLIQCALLHEQFEAIHPFGDGNGRLGRLLIILFLMERGRLTQPLLYPSDYIEAHKETYYDALQSVRTDGDWIGWIYFFLSVITESAKHGIHQASQLMDLRETYRQRLRDNSNALALVDQLFVNPFTTYPRAMKLLGVTNPTARRVVQVLEEEGIVEKVPNRTYRQLFASQPILNILAPDDISAIEQ